MAFSNNDPIDIYHVEGRRSFLIAWLCEELDISYHLKFQPDDVMGSILAIRSFYPIMPMSPVVRIGDSFVVESGAILDILLARHGSTPLKPPVDSPDFLLHTQWMHFAEGTAHARMMMWRAIALVLDVDVDELPQGYQSPSDPLAAKSSSTEPQILQSLVGPRAIFNAIEAHLAFYPFMGGSAFTAADIMMHYQVRQSYLMCLIDLVDYPKTHAWKQLVENRPAFIRADRAAHPKGVDEFGMPIGSPPLFPLRKTR